MRSAVTRELPPDVHATRAASRAAARRLLVELPTVRDRRLRRLTTAMLVLLVAAASYLILALTLVVVSQPINGNLYLINRVGFADGAAPAGATLLMDLDNNGTTWAQRWRSTTWRIHRAVVVEVVSSSGSTRNAAEDRSITAAIVATSRYSRTDTARHPNSYLVTCRAGACTPGATLLVPAAHTIGIVLFAIPI